MLKILIAACCSCGVIVLVAQQRVGIGNSNPQALLSVGANSAFSVDSIGNVVRVNNVPLSFPAVQGAAKDVLTNDGNGNLQWRRPIPQDAVLLSPVINDSLVAAGYTLFGKYLMQNFSAAVFPKNGQWQLPAVTNVPSGLNSITDYQFSSSYNEFVTYSSDGKLYFNSVSGTNWYVSPQVSVPGFAPVRSSSKLLCFGNDVFVLGGFGSGFNDFASCAKFNTQSNTWSAMSAMPDSISGATGCAANGKLYLFGGYEYNSIGSNVVINTNLYVYDIATDTWVSSPINWSSVGLPTNSGTAIKIDNKIRIASGTTVTSSPILGVRELDLTSLSVSYINTISNINHASFTLDPNNVLWTCISNPDMYFYKEEAGQSISYELAPDLFSIYGTGGSVWLGGKLYIRTNFGLFEFTPNEGPFKNVFLPKIDRVMFMYIRQ